MSSWFNSSTSILPLTNNASPSSKESSSFMHSIQDRFGGFFGSSSTPPPLDSYPPPPNFTSVFDGIFTMSRTQKMWGFLGSLFLGLLCFCIAIFLLPNILFASRQFAFYYTLGNLLLLFSTVFFVGPTQQLSLMMQRHRLIPTLLYFLSLSATLFFAFRGFNVVFIILILTVQLFSLCWYILSYIPYGPQILSRIYSLFRLLF
mmetsp:Transcript_10600/g.15522  ORF Transcript_10600/g.15522 Transcript_10600/m.15522 type:complete len:203 (+) Transcript_10600:106-714(+)